MFIFQKTATGTTQTLTAVDYTIHNNVIKLVPGTTVGSAPINFALLKVEWEDLHKQERKLLIQY